MAAIHVAQLLNHPQIRAAIERSLAARGNRGDTMIAHLDPREAALLRMFGGVGTVNPRTGLRQFYNPDAGHADPTGSAGVDSTGSGGFGASGGGYGSRVGDSGGSGLGAGGGHSGQGGYYAVGGTYDRLNQPTTPGGGGGYTPTAPINNMPPAAPVTLTPMMSSTATTDLTGGRFGALPSWATTPYQVGMAPSSYPTPGVNAALGAPGGGGGLPGGGAGGLASGGGAPGGGLTPIGAPGGPVVRLPTGGVGVTLPNGAVANVGYGNPPSAQGNYPTLPNGQTLSQYLAALKLGLSPSMPGSQAYAPSGAPAAPSAAPQPASTVPAPIKLQASGVNPAVVQGALGGSQASNALIQAALRRAAQAKLGGGVVTSGRR